MANRLMQSRRQFLISGLSAAGGLVLGMPASAAGYSASKASSERMLGFFVEILPNNQVVIGCAQPEIGQGVRTALPMLVAEELGVAWENVQVRQMPLGIIKTADGYAWKYGGQGAGGSTSVTDNWTFLREAGATARTMLITAATSEWSVAAEQCRVENGYVLCDAADKRMPFSSLIGNAANLPVPETAPQLKNIENFKIVGTPQSVVDAKDIVTGKARYGIDTRMPGMRFAVIERAPAFDSRVQSIDDSKARKIPGVLDVFEIAGPQAGEPYLVLASGVAVVADSTWAAIQGRKALKVQWTDSPYQNENTESFWKQTQGLLNSKGQVVRDDGEFESSLAAASTTVKARYQVPFVSHAPLEPQNCFADVKEGRAHIIAPTQMPSGASRAVHAVTGIAREHITVEMTRVGGGFGRRLTNDYVAEAAMISQHIAAPVKLQWTREDDIKHDFYRPSGEHELKAGVNEAGRVVAWTHRLASAGKYYRRANVAPQDQYKAEMYIDDFPAGIVENLRVEWLEVQSGIPRGSWRAPAHTANAFVVQSFLDEVAHAAGLDPLDLRLDLYGESREIPYGQHGGPTFNPWRLSRLLKHVAKEIDYRSSRPKGTAVGIASHFTFGGYAAHAVEVSMDPREGFNIERIVAAVDCGVVVNPRGVEAQLQGGTIDGLSTALNLEITVQDGRVVQNNFNDYPLLRMRDVPLKIETHILPWGDTPTGMGEMGLPTLAPALTNAIFNASGVRIRKLPIQDQLKKALG